MDLNSIEMKLITVKEAGESLGQPTSHQRGIQSVRGSQQDHLPDDTGPQLYLFLPPHSSRYSPFTEIFLSGEKCTLLTIFPLEWT